MKKTLIIGASPNPDRYAFKAAEMLNYYKHEVYAFGLKKGKINETEINTLWPDNEYFDTVTLYLSSKHQLEYFDKIIALKPKRVIFNPGTENREFQEKLIHHKINAIAACTLVLLSTGQY